MTIVNEYHGAVIVTRQTPNRVQTKIDAEIVCTTLGANPGVQHGLALAEFARHGNVVRVQGYFLGKDVR